MGSEGKCEWERHGACEGHVGPHLASSCFAFPVILRLHEDSERQADLWCFFENRFELTFSLVRHGRTRQRSLDSDILALRDASSIVSSEQLSRCAAVSSEDNLSALSREIESHKRLATARSRVKTSKWLGLVCQTLRRGFGHNCGQIVSGSGCLHSATGRPVCTVIISSTRSHHVHVFQHWLW